MLLEYIAIGVMIAVATLIAESAILLAVVRSFTFPADWWARTVNHLWRMALVGMALAVLLAGLRLRPR